MLDRKRIIAELAVSEQIVVSEDDPIFAAVLLNKLVLDQYVQEVEQQIDTSITNIAALEEITSKKLQQLMDTARTANDKELRRTLTQFSETLIGHLERKQPNPLPQPQIVYWLAVAFLSGCLIGGLTLLFLQKTRLPWT